MIHVHVVAPFLHGVPRGLIGDSLAQVPFLRAAGVAMGDEVMVSGPFNKHVIPLLEGLPIRFEPDAAAAGARHVIGAQACRDACAWRCWRWHMAQGYFLMNDMLPPELPIHLPLAVQDCGLPAPDLVLSPFSVSDLGGNKLWPHARWLSVIESLSGLGMLGKVYVLGSSSDDLSPYDQEGIETVVDRPLPQVLDLMRKSRLVMTLDNGMGHLAHFGGIKHHLMIYPDCLPPKFAESPLAVHVRGAAPVAIDPATVFDRALDALAA